MPKITEYTAPDRKLTQSTEGVAAFETAARRIGPAYQQAATDTREIGRLQAQTDKERLWPWDILELYEADRTRAASGAGSGGGGGVKFAGGDHLSPPGIGQLSRGAAALGDTAAARPDQLKRAPSKLVDVDKLFPSNSPAANTGPARLPKDMQPNTQTQVPGLYDPGREVWRDPNPLPPLPGQNPDGTFGGNSPGPATYGDPAAPTPDYSNDPVPLPGPIKNFVDWSGNAPAPTESDYPTYDGGF